MVFIKYCFHKFVLLVILLMFSNLHIDGQGSTIVDHAQLRDNGRSLITVFLDCNGCDIHHIRENIQYVNYVRDRENAQVHVLVAVQRAGVSGTNYLMFFIGRKEFEGMDNEISYFAPRTNTWGETRNGITNRIKLGLAPYVGNTEIANLLRVDMPLEEHYEREELDCPWKNWVFEIYGGANYRKEETQSSFNARYGFFADKVTEDWKIRIRPYFNYNENVFETDNGTVRSLSHRDGFNGYVIRSINQNWSVGMFSDMLSSTFHNMDFSVDVSPGVEFSIFPYTEATRRSITFVYKAGYAYQNYIETTIFEKDKENLFKQELVASVSFQQTWGSVRAGLSGSHYFHDFSANRAEFFTNINLRLFSGFSLSLRGNFDLINDLVAIPATDITLEEILLQQRRQATDHQVFGSIGISYNFGSDYANVVNTRF